MQQIINDKLYDTDTAELIYSYKDPLKERNYYRSKMGAFFVHYIGIGKMELVDEQVIKDILAERDVNKYIDIFGKVAEG